MASSTVVYDGDLSYITGDQPPISGTVTDAAGNILGLSDMLTFTIQLTTQGGGILIAESAAQQISTNGFTFVPPTPFSTWSFVTIFGRVYYLDTTDITLNGAIDDSVTTLNYTVETLSDITNPGWLKIGDEIMTYVIASPGTLTVVRGVFNTTAAAHLDNDVITFSTSQETCKSYAKFEVDTKDGQAWKFNNSRKIHGVNRLG